MGDDAGSGERSGQISPGFSRAADTGRLRGAEWDGNGDGIGARRVRSVLRSARCGCDRCRTRFWDLARGLWRIPSSFPSFSLFLPDDDGLRAFAAFSIARNGGFGVVALPATGYFAARQRESGGRSHRSAAGAPVHSEEDRRPALVANDTEIHPRVLLPRGPELHRFRRGCSGFRSRRHEGRPFESRYRSVTIRRSRVSGHPAR